MRHIRANDPSAPTHAYRTRTLSSSCHSEPVLTLAWESVPPVPASLTEGGVTAKGRDGGRDMPRQRRGIRGDVGIAPYTPSIEIPCVTFGRSRPVRPYIRLPSVRPVFSLSFRGREAPVGIRSPFHINGGQRPPPTFAAARQRRDLIIAQTPGGCFQRGRAAALPLWSLKDGGFSRGKEDRNFLPP